MDLYIKVEDGNPVDHPILGENLRNFYPDLSEDNIPEGYVKFIRKPHPATTRFQKLAVGAYVWEDNVITDNWLVEEVTGEEKAEIISKIRSKQPFPSWTFDETNYVWTPPVTMPNDGNRYKWDEESQSWQILNR